MGRMIIQIGDKVRTVYANMLKQHVERQSSKNTVPREKPQPEEHRFDAGCSVLQIAGASTIEPGEAGVEKAVDDDDLLELGTVQSEETASI